MIIDFKYVSDNKNFEKVSNGVVFGFGGGFYIKMPYDVDTGDALLNAVDLESGEPVFFDDDDEVTAYPKAKMYIE